MEQDMGTPNVEDVVRGFVKLRDKKNEIKKRHSEELAPINEKMATLEAWLQRDLLNRHVQSQKTAAGTAYLSTDARATVKDRDAYLKFVIENEKWDLIENRASKSVVKDYLEETGEVVPGVHYEVTQVVRVRR
jgi:hypothetical protein